jgi:hypothetical protein
LENGIGMRALFVYIFLCIVISCFSQNGRKHKKTDLADTLKQSILKPDPAEQKTSHPLIPEDSTQAAFIRDSMKLVTPKLIRAEARIDSRASVFQGTKVNIYGYYVGLLIKAKLSLGLGYYRINTVLPLVKEVNGIKTSTTLIVNCGSLNSELIYFNRRFISLGFPLEFAFGQYDLTNTTVNENKLIDQQIKFLSFANFGLSATFKPFKFIGLKLMGGYRKSIYPEEKTFEFNGVYSSLGLYVDMVDFLNNIKMFRLLKKYHKVKNPLSTYVDLFSD